MDQVSILAIEVDLDLVPTEDGRRETPQLACCGEERIHVPTNLDRPAGRRRPDRSPHSRISRTSIPCGLTMQEVEGRSFVESGWHVRSDLRRRGYAAEAAQAVREAARAAGVEHLIAIIRPDNLPSQRVAAKIGLVLERETERLGGPALVFGADLNRDGRMSV